MWYVIQVMTGTEEKVRTLALSEVPRDTLQQCLIYYREEPRKIHGEWCTLKRRLFPGYLFLVTDDIDALRAGLQTVPAMTRLLRVGDEIIPLTEEEILFLGQFSDDSQVVGMSRGVSEGSFVRVVSGPLVGREGIIRKIDRHRRRAWLEMEMFGRRQRIQLGLEIVEEKTETDKISDGDR